MLGEDDTQYQWMATKIHVVGEPPQNPHRQSVHEFFERVDQDFDGWFPGRTFGKAAGRPADMIPRKRKAIATSMMAAKKRGDIPSADLATARCPAATLNESTGKPFSRNVINEVLTTDCYDETPDKPWEFRFAAHRKALTQVDKDARYEWGGRFSDISFKS